MAANYKSNRARVEAAFQSQFQRGAINMAGDIVRLSTPVTPFRDGDLRIRRRVSPLPNGARIEWLAGHAAVQNRGMRNGQAFRNYTTPGTGPGFVQKGIEAVKPRVKDYFK